MSAPIGDIHQTALTAEPAYHRDHRERDAFTELALWPQISRSALLEAYVVVCVGTQRATKVGERSWLMSHVHVGHDVEIGDDCEICPGVVLCGHVTVGNGVRMGVNACVHPGVTIGEGARIGMGAVVLEDVPGGEVWAGNPARRIKGPCRGGCGTLTAGLDCPHCTRQLLGGLA